MSYNINYNIKGVSGQTLYSLPSSSGSTNQSIILNSDGTSTWGTFLSANTSLNFVSKTGDTMTGTLLLPYLTATTISATTLKSVNDATINTLTIGQGNNGSDDSTALGSSSLSSSIGGAVGNTAVGVWSLRSLTTGAYNTSIGSFSSSSIVNGGGNVSVGSDSLLKLVSGNENVAIGNNALYNNITGSSNVAVGRYSLYTTSGSSNVSIGYKSGYYSTGSSELFIHNQDNGTYNNDKTNSIIYGVMASAPASQSLYLNATVYVNNKYSLPTTSGASGYILTSNGSTTYWASATTSTPSIQAFSGLTFGTTLNWNLTNSTNATVTLTGNVTTFNITGLQNGISGVLKIVQDGVGGRTLALPLSPVSEVANGGNSSVILTTTAGAVDILSFVYDGTKLYWNAGYNYN